MKKLIFIIVIILLGYWIWRTAHHQPTPVVAPTVEQTVSATFYDQTTGEATQATFGDRSVTFTNAKLGTMTLPQTISADGGRYANADESIVFWNKGDSVFITQNGVIVFNGSTGEPAQGKRPAGSATAPDPTSLIGTWVWDHTTMRDASIVTPKKAAAFSVTFAADGKLSGTTDCNSFGGTYMTGSDGVLTVSGLVSTLKYCAGSQESVFTGQITKSFQYSFDDTGHLVISIDNGSIVLAKK